MLIRMNIPDQETAERAMAAALEAFDLMNMQEHAIDIDLEGGRFREPVHLCEANDLGLWAENFQRWADETEGAEA